MLAYLIFSFRSPPATHYGRFQSGAVSWSPPPSLSASFLALSTFFDAFNFHRKLIHTYFLQSPNYDCSQQKHNTICLFTFLHSLGVIQLLLLSSSSSSSTAAAVEQLQLFCFKPQAAHAREKKRKGGRESAHRLMLIKKQLRKLSKKIGLGNCSSFNGRAYLERKGVKKTLKTACLSLFLQKYKTAVIFNMLLFPSTKGISINSPSVSGKK